MNGHQLDEALQLRHAMERYETAERVASERLKGLQNQERQIKELKRELMREKAINDALSAANQNGLARLEELQQRHGRLREAGAAWKEVNPYKELEEAKAAAARADKAATSLHHDLQAAQHIADSRLMKIRKLEQQVQSCENMIARKDSSIGRMRDRIQQLERQQGVAVPAVIEAIRALLHDESHVWGWGWDAARFAQELTNRFRGRGK